MNKRKHIMWIWRIKKTYWPLKSNKGRRIEEYIVANEIQDVWEYLKTDLIDEALEVESIERTVSCLKIMPPKK